MVSGAEDTGGGVSYGSRVYEWDEGTLIIDVVDGSSRKLVWRGTGRKAVSRHPTPEQVTRSIDAAVHKILGQFPPERSGSAQRKAGEASRQS